MATKKRLGKMVVPPDYYERFLLKSLCFLKIDFSPDEHYSKFTEHNKFHTFMPTIPAAPKI